MLRGSQASSEFQPTVPPWLGPTDAVGVMAHVISVTIRFPAEANLSLSCSHEEQKKLAPSRTTAAFQGNNITSLLLLTRTNSSMECSHPAEVNPLIYTFSSLPPSLHPLWMTICRRWLVQDVGRLLIHFTHTHIDTHSRLPTRFD